MGAPTPQIQSSTQPQGKGAPAPAIPDQNFQSTSTGQPAGMQRPIGKGGAITTPIQSGQPSIGRPNNYANTVGPWDNARIGTQSPQVFRYVAPPPVMEPSNSGKFGAQPNPNDINGVFGRIMAERFGSRFGKGA